MPVEEPADRRQLLRVSLDDELPDREQAEQVGLELAEQLKARVAVDREVARRLRRFLTRTT